MKAHRPIQTAAFTMIEMLMVILIIGILASHLLPALARAKPKVYRVECMNNLRQIGLGFQMFANEHQQTFPMQVSTREGGSLEYVAGGNAFRHFSTLSNDLNSPRIFVCRSDPRLPAETWPQFNNTHLSFFVGVDAKPSYPNSLLAGDRNISQDSVQRSNLLETAFPATIGWTTNMHNEKGNVLFSSGQVSFLDTQGLQDAFHNATEK